MRAIAARLPDAGVDDVPVLAAQLAVDSFKPAVQAKAWWTVEEVARSTEGPLPPRDEFLAGYCRAWSVFYLEAAAALCGASQPLTIESPLPQVLWLFHFPEYPRVAQLWSDGRAVALVKRLAPWMRDGRVVYIDDPMSLRRLLSHIRNGGTVMAMVDHAFATTHNRAVPFLGRPCGTPMGLFEVAARLRISMGLVMPRGRSWAIARFDPARFDSAIACAGAVLNLLGQVILAEPERWLLWPNLNHRWGTDR